ncbi:ATP-dependent DNA ligase, partial [Candidatus Gottesmanbacteria bacterium]|nr:ATP-dependent DNA ligase [Candidatus Gottesmanbacteria bacterium]
MTFKRLSEYFAQLEATTLRNKMTEILAALFKEAKADEIGKLCYLLQGRVAPLFTAVEFGIADRMMVRAIALGLDVSQDKVTKAFKQEGDLGKAVEKLKAQSSKLKAKEKKLTILDVYEILYNVATAGGSGSQEIKIKLLGDLLHDVDPLSSRYIVKITLAKLRMGFSDMTMLDSLSWMLAGTKELRVEIERAYNVRPDLGFISETIKRKGIEGLRHVEPKVGTPILMARAERMTNGKDIIEKIGKCAIEPKYDGFRLQAHFDGKNVELISRNLENVTHMYPDIVAGIKKQIKAKNAILEGEAIGINLKTGEYLPFQETVQRKRKYDIEAKAKEIPLTLFTFDCLYVDGESFLGKSYIERRKKLTELFKSGEVIYIASEEVTDNPARIEEIFLDATTRGLEGVMAKKLDGIYRAGARDFNWIKYKRSYASKLSDIIDAVVMGYDLGQGKRTSFGIGDFLIGILDEKQDKFATVAKIGTGLTDDEWRELKLKIKNEKLKIDKKPEKYNVDKMMECDVWVEP